jgi:hypothetical protein
MAAIDGGAQVIKIEFLGKSRVPGLIRPGENEAWMRTPVGMAGRLGSGPPGATCLGCVHLALAELRWSDHGRAAPCLERRRLSGGKKTQEVPVPTPACSRFEERSGLAAAIASADQYVDERIVAKRQKIRDLEQAAKRLNDEIRELQQTRSDPGEDPAWRGFEPVEPAG